MYDNAANNDDAYDDYLDDYGGGDENTHKRNLLKCLNRIFE